jgi:Fic-DOC domain mobile mystery protein B
MDWGDQPEGATLLPHDRREGLRLSWVTSMDDLNEAEAENILGATTKWYGRRNALETLLDDKTVRDLHRDMLGDVWTWAGTYRLRGVNVGIVAPAEVPLAVRNLVEDAKYWFAEDSSMDVDRAAVEFHHRLVLIHPFANGNGRHSRLLTDLLLRAAGVVAFAWGSSKLAAAGDVRARYIAALKKADDGDHTALLEFVRS